MSGLTHVYADTLLCAHASKLAVLPKLVCQDFVFVCLTNYELLLYPGEEASEVCVSSVLYRRRQLLKVTAAGIM